MGANQSPYTKDSTMYTVMRDYPWGQPVSQAAKDLDIPIEVSLYGVLGLVLAILDKTAVLGLYADPGTENEKGIYSVNVGMYTLDGFFNILTAVFSIIIISFGI